MGSSTGSVFLKWRWLWTSLIPQSFCRATRWVAAWFVLFECNVIWFKPPNKQNGMCMVPHITTLLINLDLKWMYRSAFLFVYNFRVGECMQSPFPRVLSSRSLICHILVSQSLERGPLWPQVWFHFIQSFTFTFIFHFHLLVCCFCTCFDHQIKWFNANGFRILIMHPQPCTIKYRHSCATCLDFYIPQS